MIDDQTLSILRTIVTTATPLLIASMGETITERAGVINLSLDGSMVLTAMVAFAAASLSGSVMVGLIAAITVGALIALLIAVSSIELRLDQVAVGFVLTLLCANLAEFMGVPFAGQPTAGLTLRYAPIPLLQDVPVVGRVFFQANLLVYFSYVLVIVTWFWLYRTHGGLAHRAIGERPEAAFARGTDVNRLRYLYTMIGGGLVGLAGAAYTLAIKPGWITPPSMQGDGWIALAIVIFGGWHPFRVILGTYLFAGLRAIAGNVQGSGLNIPVTVLNALPWVLMILTLLLVSSGGIDAVLKRLPRRMQQRLRAFLRSDPPAALGRRFDQEGA